MRRKELFYYVTWGSNVTPDVHWCVTVNCQQIANGNIANQIHGITIDYGKFILIHDIIHFSHNSSPETEAKRSAILFLRTTLHGTQYPGRRWTWHDKCNICSRYCIYLVHKLFVKLTSYCKLIECSRPIRFFIVSLMYNNVTWYYLSHMGSRTVPLEDTCVWRGSSCNWSEIFEWS